MVKCNPACCHQSCGAIQLLFRFRLDPRNKSPAGYKGSSSKHKLYSPSFFCSRKHLFLPHYAATLLISTPPMDDIHISHSTWYGMLSSNDGILKHCVRCHREYTIVSSRSLCSIPGPHVFKPVPFKESDPSTGITCLLRVRMLWP